MKRFSHSKGHFHIFVFYLWLRMQTRRERGGYLTDTDVFMSQLGVFFFLCSFLLVI